MTSARMPFYSPALRMKQGELIGLKELTDRVADHVLPRLIIPPAADRDSSLQGVLIEGERFPVLGAVLSQYWRHRPVLVDTRYLEPQFGDDRLSDWLPPLVAKALDVDVLVTAVARVPDLLGTQAAAFKAAAGLSPGIRLAILISYDELATPEWRNSLGEGLTRMELHPADCSVIADFSNADFSQTELVSGVLQGALEDLQDFGNWRHIISQGTNFPDVNPAKSGKCSVVQRNEWLAWCDAAGFDPTTADHLIFGDYGADNAKMNFAKSRAPAIPHLRYATKETWNVERGEENVTLLTAMRGVSSNILNNDEYSGRDFSFGDDSIYQIAKGYSGSRTPKDWRAINMNHHITRVVADVGHVRSVRFPRRDVSKLPEQEELFVDEQK